MDCGRNSRSTVARKVSWSDLIQPTIELLEEGFPTSHALAKALERKAELIVNESTMREFVNPETGNVYRVGDQIRTRTSLLRTLRLLSNSSDPVREFYHGAMAREMAKEFEQYGGIITEADFSEYRSIVVPHSGVIYTNLKNGRVVCGPPPPSGSAVAQAILNVMDGIIHERYAARTWLGDPAFVDNATAIAHNITSKKWAEWV
ncbi:gamma-glutamyltranspeptidase, partial [Cooperia oncophora]